MRIDYVKYNSRRRREYATKTVIATSDSGKTLIRKQPLYPEGLDFVLGLTDKYHLMQAAYQNLDICPCLEEADGVSFDYVNGKSFQDLLVKLIVTRNKKAFVDLIYQYREIILDNGHMLTHIMTTPPPGFTKIFGDFDLGRYALEAVDFSNIDLSFENLILRNGRWTIFDYEWCFPMAVPLQYIIYRNVGTFYAKQERKLHADNFISFKEVLKLFDISDDILPIFAGMEEHFQRYVHGGSGELYQRYLKRQLSPWDVRELEAAAERGRDYVKLYWLVGEYTEENSLRLLSPLEHLSAQQEFQLEIPLAGLPLAGREVRVDFTEKPCAIQVIRCYIANLFGEHIADLTPKFINNNMVFEDYFVFCHDDPQIIFAPLPLAGYQQDDTRLVLELMLAPLPSLMERYRLHTQEEQAKLLDNIRRSEESLQENRSQLEALREDQENHLREAQEAHRQKLVELKEQALREQEELKEQALRERKALEERMEYIHTRHHEELERHANAESILAADVQALRQELDNIYSSRSWRWIMRLRRLLRRN